jgi:hypothetical protein
MSSAPASRFVLIAEGLFPPEKIKVLAHGSIDGVEADRKFNPARISAESTRLVRARYQIPQGALVMGFVGRIERSRFQIRRLRRGQQKHHTGEKEEDPRHLQEHSQLRFR